MKGFGCRILFDRDADGSLYNHRSARRMAPLSIILLLGTVLAGALPLFGSDSSVNDAPMAFSSLDTLRSWAKKEPFGGDVQVLCSGTNRVAIARRSFSSGVASCDFWVFMEGQQH
jgi:hypothetical protein